MMKKFLAAALWLLLALPVGSALAQTGTIIGTVTDTTTGQPLPGVNVVIQDLNIGAATDASGMYRIEEVPVGEHTIVASFIGYQTEFVPITVEEGLNEVDIQLTSQAIGLEDVVVTALGIEREARSLGYSVQEVEGEDLARVPEVNFIEALTGQVAGASFYSSNAMGGSTRIVLRGANSIGGNNQPLIVIDGIPMNNANFIEGDQNLGDGGYDYGNAAQIINPANVASVSILKGPAAAALYGSRAANGVIQITTKSGEFQQGIGVTINTGVTIQDIYGLPNYQNRYGGGGYAPFAINDEGQFVVDTGTDQSWGPRLDGRLVRQWYSYDDVNGLLGQATPWVGDPGNIEEFFHTGVNFNTTVAFAHGGENFNYRLSLGNVAQSYVYPNSNLNRSNIGFNGSVDLTDRLTASATGHYVDTDALGRPGTGYSNAVNVFLQFNQFGQRQIHLGEGTYMRDYLRPDGSQRGWNWFSLPEAERLLYASNPYWVRFENFQNDDTERFYGSFRIAYDFMDNLTLAADVRTDFYTQRRQERIAVGSVAQAEYAERIREVQETNAGLQLTYDTDLSESFTLEGLLGSNISYQTFNRNVGVTQGGLSVPELYTLENSVGRPFIDDYFRESAIFGLYGAATIGYEGLLFLRLTGRNDWSSTLPAGNNSYFYPSAALSFVFSDLEALQDSDVISYGKLRVAYARVGSDTEPYRILQTYPIGTPFEGNPVLSVSNTLNNPNLKPEITSSWSIGTNLQFFNNRLGLDATYYYDVSRNQILPIEVSRASGYARVLINAGELNNQGLELSLTTTPILTEEFQWDVNINWAKNVNEVTALAEDVTTYTLGGESLNFGPRVVARIGEPYGSFFGDAFVYDANGNLVLTGSGYPLSSSTAEVLGKYTPDWTGGVSSTFSYKGFSANVTFTGQKGGLIYSLSNAFGLYSGMLQETVEGNIRRVGLIPEGVWFPENYDGDDVTVDPSENVGEPWTQQVDPNFFMLGLFVGPDESHMYDASYIKLREVSLGYTFPRQWFGGMPIRSLTMSVVAQNVATLLKYTPNFDPSYAISAGNVQGFEMGQVPPTRSFGINLRMTL